MATADPPKGGAGVKGAGLSAVLGLTWPIILPRLLLSTTAKWLVTNGGACELEGEGGGGVIPYDGLGLDNKAAAFGQGGTDGWED